MDNLDFDGSYEILMEALDASYKRLRKVHANPLHLNDESAEYKKLREEFRWAESQIFSFKNLWTQVLKVRESNKTRPTDM